MQIRKHLLVWTMLGVLALATAVPGASAQSGGPVPGTYRCSSYNASGGGGSCRSTQPLRLNPDGSYQYSSTRGRWSVGNGKLLLSESRLWGPGEILGSHTVRFEYDYRGWHHVVTWICQECAYVEPKETGSAETRGSAVKGFYVGVSITLEFDTDVGGVSSFTIVPTELARSYTHNAPLPEGSVQGLAWETSRTAVALATNRNNKLMSGKQYVVFLSWPRETIPVAILDLPSVSKDYSTTLQATLDGASVLAQLGKRGP